MTLSSLLVTLTTSIRKHDETEHVRCAAHDNAERHRGSYPEDYPGLAKCHVLGFTNNVWASCLMTAAEDKHWWPTGAWAGVVCSEASRALQCLAKADAGEGDHPGQGPRELLGCLALDSLPPRPSCKMQRRDLRCRRSACRSPKGRSASAHVELALPFASQVLQVPATGARGGADCRACHLGLR